MTDITQTLVIKVILDGKEFSKFECKQKETDISVNLGQLTRILKSLNGGDKLEMFIKEDDKQHLVIKMGRSNDNIFRLKLLDLDKNELQLKEIKYDTTIVFRTAYLNKLFKEMSLISDYVEIICTVNDIRFSCKGDYAERCTICPNKDESEKSTTKTKSKDSCEVKIIFSNESKVPIVQGIYELKYLISFTKYSTLSDYVYMAIGNNFPILLNYKVATLGSLTFCQSPVNDPNMQEEEAIDEFNNGDKDEFIN